MRPPASASPIAASEGQRAARPAALAATALMAKAWLTRPWSSFSRITSTPSRSESARLGQEPARRAQRDPVPVDGDLLDGRVVDHAPAAREERDLRDASRLEPGRGHRHGHRLGRRAKRGGPGARAGHRAAGPLDRGGPGAGRGLARDDRQGEGHVRLFRDADLLADQPRGVAAQGDRRARGQSGGRGQPREQHDLVGVAVAHQRADRHALGLREDERAGLPARGQRPSRWSGGSPESPGLVQYVCQPGAMRWRRPTQKDAPGSMEAASLSRVTETRGGPGGAGS